MRVNEKSMSLTLSEFLAFNEFTDEETKLLSKKIDHALEKKKEILKKFEKI